MGNHIHKTIHTAGYNHSSISIEMHSRHWIGVGRQSFETFSYMLMVKTNHLIYLENKPLLTSHIRTVLSSMELDANLYPSGEKANLGPRLYSGNWIFWIVFPAVISQNRIVPSSELDTSVRPLGEKATSVTHLLWLSNNRTSSPNLRSKRWTRVLELDATVHPSGANVIWPG